MGLASISPHMPRVPHPPFQPPVVSKGTLQHFRESSGASRGGEVLLLQALLKRASPRPCGISMSTWWFGLVHQTSPLQPSVLGVPTRKVLRGEIQS